MGKIKAVAFDLDGTVYFGDQIADGIVEIIDYLRYNGIKIVYFTNNSYSHRDNILQKLRKFGIEANIHEIYTSGYACALYTSQQGLRNVYCLGSEGLIAELREKGINISSTKDSVQALIVGLDKDFSYRKLAVALNLWKPGIRVIACNRDRYFPIEDGCIMPGCGAIVAALEEAAGKKVDYVVGKPNTFMIQTVLADLGLTKQSILIVGDSIETDIAMAERYGCSSVLVNSSSKIRTFQVKTLRGLPRILEEINSGD